MSESCLLHYCLSILMIPPYVVLLLTSVNDSGFWTLHLVMLHYSDLSTKVT